MTLAQLKDILQLTNAMRSALNREVNDLEARPDYALLMLNYIQDIELKAMQMVVVA